MLELESITFRNFLSFGDYDTTVALANVGQCLITGQVLDAEKEAYDEDDEAGGHRSNGAGKSSCTAPIQWVLFGRTMHCPNPGNKVLNWFTGKDCLAQLTFRNGDTISRHRQVNGRVELQYMRNGDVRTLTSETLSTTKNHEAELARQFHLDWQLFCGSAFFNQFGVPWMQMAEQTRKRALERLLRVDRLILRAEVGKERLEQADKNAQDLQRQIALAENEAARATQQIAKFEEQSKLFEDNKNRHLAELIATLQQEEVVLAKFELPDIEKLKTKWNVVAKLDGVLRRHETVKNGLVTKVSEHRGIIRNLEVRIGTWKQKAGRICTECEQVIDVAMVAQNKLAPMESELEVERVAVEALRTEIADLESKLAEAMRIKRERSPTMTLTDVDRMRRQQEQAVASIRRIKDQIAKTERSQNTYATQIEELSTDLASLQEDLGKLQKQCERMIYLQQHFQYIHRAYNDRKRIKSFIFDHQIPYINGRLKHYLEAFGLDVTLQLTNSLSIESNLWTYEFESGGERFRTDVAWMLAVYDFHEHTYGRQCNVMLMDDVDGGLDEDGVNSFINIIKNDLAPRIESIFVVSHREQMRDVFPREIKVTRENRLSKLETV